MKNRLSLIIDLESFHKELTELDDRNNFVNRNKYFELMQRVEKLSEADFEPREKYNYFLKYVNQAQNKADRDFFEQNFIENHIELGLIWITNYIYRMIPWLK